MINMLILVILLKMMSVDYFRHLYKTFVELCCCASWYLYGCSAVQQCFIESKWSSGHHICWFCGLSKLHFMYQVFT